MIVIKSSNGIWPLALKASGQPPLFWLSTGYVGPIEGPELESYPGIIFYISGHGINLPSTYCVLNENSKTLFTLVSISWTLVSDFPVTAVTL